MTDYVPISIIDDNTYLRNFVIRTITDLRDLQEKSSPEYVLKKCLTALEKCEIQEQIIKEQDYWIERFMKCFIDSTVLRENKLRQVYEVTPNYESIGKAVVVLLQNGVNIRGYEFEPFIDIISPTKYEYIVKDRYHKLFNYLKER